MIPSAKYDFKFKDYAPWVFRHLRARFQLDPADYLMSLTGKYILSELGSPGKSGSFFYFSRDYKYIIKTIHHAEHKFLRKILKDYYRHVEENPNTLLSQFYGLHRVKMPYGKKIHFVVMNNLFPPHRDIHQTYDLKGSTLGRDYKEDNLEENPRATLKDLNWLRRNRHLELGLQKKKLFLEQLQKDVRLLQKLEIMDYSLLVGIHDLQRGNEENLRDKTLRVFNPGGDNSREDPSSVLLRTPSKLENARKAKELRQMVKTERPVPMGETSSRMPDELEHNQSRTNFVFNADDGGFRATHEDNTPADEIYYLGVIDCLTHVSSGSSSMIRTTANANYSTESSRSSKTSGRGRLRAVVTKSPPYLLTSTASGSSTSFPVSPSLVKKQFGKPRSETQKCKPRLPWPTRNSSGWAVGPVHVTVALQYHQYRHSLRISHHLYPPAFNHRKPRQRWRRPNVKPTRLACQKRTYQTRHSAQRSPLAASNAGTTLLAKPASCQWSRRLQRADHPASNMSATAGSVT